MDQQAAIDVWQRVSKGMIERLAGGEMVELKNATNAQWGSSPEIVVCICVGFEDAIFGSVIAKQDRDSPLSSGSKCCCCCCVLPNRSSSSMLPVSGALQLKTCWCVAR